jgi:hypothetical protein
VAARKPFLLRIDPALWAELETWAQDELRSVNGQIEYILRQAVVKRRGGASAAKPAEKKADSPEV